MNMTDLDIVLQKELGAEINVPLKLDNLVQQKMEAISQKKTKRRLSYMAVASIRLAILEMFIILSFCHSIGLKIIIVVAHISLLCILIFYAIISSTDTLKRKELHYA